MRYTKYVTKVTDNMFNVYSDMAQVDYYVCLANESDLDTAMEIADREFGKWCCPSLLDDDEEYEHYYNAGYTEVVSDALTEANIEFDIYVKE